MMDPTPRLTPVEIVLEALQNHGHKYRRNGHTWQATCPAHPDRTPSLSITESPTGNALIYCHAGCTTPAIVEELGLKFSDLFPPTNITQIHSGRRIDKTYRYHNIDGELTYEVVRYTPKGFAQRRPDTNGGWIWKLGDTQPVLYQTPQIAHAVKTGKTIWICEGEKDAENAQWWQPTIVATTKSGGACKHPDNWHASYTALLEGAKRVVIVADNDPPGHQHARTIHNALQGHVQQLSIVLPADPHKDLSDHIANFLAIDRLQRITIDQLNNLNPTEDLAADTHELDVTATDEELLAHHKKTYADIIRAQLYTYNTLANIPDPEWLIDTYLTTDSLALLVGPPGHGKSFVAIDWACHVATGLTWQEHATPAGTVIYILAEGVRGVRKRIQSWIEHHQGPTPTNLLIHPYAIDIADPQWAEGVATVADENEARLVIIDTLARNMISGDENATRDMNVFIAGLDRIRRASNACVLTVHHQARAGNIRGAIALEGAMDTIIGCTQEGNTISLKMGPPHGKQKESEPAPDLTISRIEVGASCVLVTYSPAHGLSPDLDELLADLHENDPSNMGLSKTVWTCESVLSKATLGRRIRDLTNLRLVQVAGNNKSTLYKLTDQGKQYVERTYQLTDSRPTHDILSRSDLTDSPTHHLYKGESVTRSPLQITAEDII